MTMMFLIIPACIGSFIADYLRIKDAAARLLSAWVIGFVQMLAVGQLILVPFVKMQQSLTNASMWFRIALQLLVAAALIHKLWMAGKETEQTRVEKQSGQKKNLAAWLFCGIAFVMILMQAYIPARYEHSDDDEIILCLNYDGLYGINNINRFLQNGNPNMEVVWGINTYKVGDPILFNESNIFSPLIHNNSKGRIIGIHQEERQLRFDIELEEPINGIDSSGYSFDLVGESETGKTIISFSVNKYRSTDEDDDVNDSTVVPFQVAYAVSIHKAQGLEYDSVKIVITNEIEERITHNIFYTAITRAKKKLKIYWSPETEQAVLSRLSVKNVSKDAYLLAQLSSLTMAM